jgi:hypothetical protein
LGAKVGEGVTVAVGGKDVLVGDGVYVLVAIGVLVDVITIDVVTTDVTVSASGVLFVSTTFVGSSRVAEELQPTTEIIMNTSNQWLRNESRWFFIIKVLIILDRGLLIVCYR